MFSVILFIFLGISSGYLLRKKVFALLRQGADRERQSDYGFDMAVAFSAWRGSGRQRTNHQGFAHAWR